MITGARGFVGSRVLPHLLGEFEVHAVSRESHVDDKIHWHSADLTDSESCARLIAKTKPAYLVHCAWETQHGAFWEAETNRQWYEAGKVLFQTFQSAGGQRIVALGSCAEYTGSDQPLTEIEDQDTPATLYGQSKLSLLNDLQSLPVSFSWARIFHLFGPHENPYRFVPSLCRALLSETPAECSSGRQVRDLSDVRDVALSIAMLVKSPIEGAINLGHGSSTTLADVALELGRIAERPDLIRVGALPDRPGEPRVLIPDLTRQFQELNAPTARALQDSLQSTFEWWRRHKDER
ncbi:NAD(P)-dependent oxidoreductase [Aliiroseovarius sp. KMU-50]|uniref:NAD(P)-dependent oxidoreductase n=1 Tax=Aliiroseovarius salicola TaxID=3009082 RepID=A0ABT4W6I9_9RHOB|nr:NAD(P)-dependent oxidoreductase [Aliiroseovarius sp. KMU-50]MDA5095740.1 NAD(P)-dependent oxidoreductase [Aliiroseovarius sp. KMU-50]